MQLDKPPKIKARNHPKADLKERQALQKIFDDPIFIKAIECAEMMKPGAFCSGVGTQVEDPARSLHIANNRLHEIRGWELFEHALYLQAADPKPERPKIEETYPDEGRIDHEW